MTEHVQRLRHTPELAAAYVGLEGEWTGEIGTGAIHVHDFTTPGGYVHQDQSTYDLRYQGADEVLDQLAAIAGEGLVVKRSTTIAALELTGGANITITNGDGQAGNPAIAVSGLGDNAYTSGTAGTRDTGTGANQVPLASQIPGLLVGAGAVPVGGVIIWSGTVATIPTNFHLCDGTNGTIDMRSIIPAGVSQDSAGVAKTNIRGTLEASGGAYAANTGLGGTHDHGGNTQSHVLDISEIPAHQHNVGYSNNVSGNGSTQNAIAGGSTLATSSTGGGLGHLHGITAAADHVHTSPFPPFKAVCFIQRIA